MAKKQTLASEIGSALGAAAARAEKIISTIPTNKTAKPAAKRTTSAKHSTAKKTVAPAAPVEVATASQPAAEPVKLPNAIVAIEISREEIALQAYLYWEARGYQGGNSQADWLRAEAELKQRAISAAA